RATTPGRSGNDPSGTTSNLSLRGPAKQSIAGAGYGLLRRLRSRNDAIARVFARGLRSAHLQSGKSLSAYFTVITRPLRSALTTAPTELPLSDSTAPLPLVRTIACPPRPMAAPTLPAA